MTSRHKTNKPGTFLVARQLWFTGPRQVGIREQALPSPGAGELLVKTECSALSAGTELLVYRGQLPQQMPLDANLSALKGASAYPLQYGYASVGRVVQAGPELAPQWLARQVFVFVPHASHFLTTVDNVILVPDDIDASDAVFLANMETAVNLVHDGGPMLGERVAVLGQGIVGLLLSGLLAQFPLDWLVAIDGIALRRNHALKLGVHHTCDPASESAIAALVQELSDSEHGQGADLVYEISGVPAALNLAITLSGYTSRIVIGSWYGTKSSAINLGGEAHRNRLRITTSQVSTIEPALSGRWNKARRFDVAWEKIRQLKPQQLISHRVALSDADDLFKQMDQSQESILQAVFLHD